VVDDVHRRTPIGFRGEGEAIWLLGNDSEELAGSVWADVLHDHLGGLPPAVDLDHERRLAEVLIAAAQGQLLSSAHDLADGGLAQALVESMLRYGHGASVDLPSVEPTAALFAEGSGRVLVSLPADREERLGALCAEHGIRAQRLGEVTAPGGDATLEVRDHFTLPLADLRTAWQAPIPTVMAAAGH